MLILVLDIISMSVLSEEFSILSFLDVFCMLLIFKCIMKVLLVLFFFFLRMEFLRELKGFLFVSWFWLLLLMFVDIFIFGILGLCVFFVDRLVYLNGGEY